MKRFLLSLMAFFLIAGLCPAISGCCSYKLKTLADGVDSATSEIFREYEAIVIEGKPRPGFSESDKEIRRNSLRKVQELIRQARR